MRTYWILTAGLTAFFIIVYADACGRSVLLPVSEKQVQNESKERLMRLLDDAGKQVRLNPEISDSLLRQAHELLSRQKDTLARYRYYHLSGVTESLRGNQSEALKNFLSAYELAKLMNDTAAMAHTCNNLGILMEKLDKIGEARHYYHKAMTSYRLLGDMDGEAACLNNLGNIFQNIDSVDMALHYYLKVIEIKKNSRDSAALAHCFGNLGNLYRGTNKYGLSENYYLKGLSIFKRLKDTASIARSHLNLAVLYRNLSRKDLMQKHLMEGHKMASHEHEYALMVLYCEIISETKASLGQYEEAYQWRVKYENAHEKYLSEENRRQINEMQVKYESRSKARQIQLLRKEQQLKEIRLEQQSDALNRAKIQVILSVFFIALLIVSGYLWLRSNRLRQRSKYDSEKIRNREEQIKTIIHTQEAERNRFAKDLHDGLGQHLTALKMSVINLPGASSGTAGREEPEGYQVMMERFNDLYQELRNISFNIMPQELDQNGLVVATERLVEKINCSHCKVRFFSYGLKERLPSSSEIAIYRIVQELINNAVKHSESDEINLTYTGHENELNIMVEFNGKGFATKRISESKGNGWKNIYSRLEMMNGRIDIDSSPERDFSTIIIDIPLA